MTNLSKNKAKILLKIFWYQTTDISIKISKKIIYKSEDHTRCKGPRKLQE